MSPPDRLRIGIVCPYSLTVPGGVQAQVLGLARELRRRGHEARVLGPCDGPPPESFVTPLGDSLPLSANGSIAPLAPDPSAALRTLRVLADEEFDVVHIHEPLAPGPTSTALMVHAAPTVGTFHAAGTSASYRFLRGSLTRLIRRIECKVVVSKDALALVQGHLGGDYVVLFNGVELEAIRSIAPWTPEPGASSERPAIFFCGRHEERKGLRVLVEAVRSGRSGGRCLDRQRWPRYRRADGGDRWRWPIPLAGARDRRREVRTPPRRRRLLCALVARRVVRGRVDRGHGGGHDGRREFTRRLPKCGHLRRRRVARRAR